MGRRIKILSIAFLLLLVSINPGAMENNFNLVDKLVPDNVRLTNSISEGQEFLSTEKTINAFLNAYLFKVILISIPDSKVFI